MRSANQNWSLCAAHTANSYGSVGIHTRRSVSLAKAAVCIRSPTEPGRCPKRRNRYGRMKVPRRTSTEQRRIGRSGATFIPEALITRYPPLPRRSTDARFICVRSPQLTFACRNDPAKIIFG
jgi:hypothetical protein